MRSAATARFTAGCATTLGERCGAVCRMTLNYDFTFLAALLSGPIATSQRRCIASPIKRRAAADPNQALELAADVGVILTYWKLRGRRGRPRRHLRSGMPGCRRCAGRRLSRGGGAPSGAGGRHRSGIGAPWRAGKRPLPHTIRISILPRSLRHRRRAVRSHPSGGFSGSFSTIWGAWIYLVDALDDLREDAESGNITQSPCAFLLEGRPY